MTRVEKQFEADPHKVMRFFTQNPPWHRIIFQPQHRFVTDNEGNLLTDFLGRVEHMQRSYDEIAERIGIPTAELARVNASERRDYRGYYTPELVERVGKLYARDLELFGYEF
jgi:hypothetical protein